MSKIHNFSAGPAILPQEVLEQAAAACTNFYKGLSILEISHRDPSFVDVMEEARSRAKQLMGLGNDYTALFLQGGASLQFAMVPMNLLKTNAAYLNTGTWATAAIKDAQLYGEVAVVASSEDTNFNYIPKNVVVPDTADYFHITTNNTIFGTRITNLPDIPQNVPLVADTSSEMFSRQMDFSRFALIYAGAQKNMGPAGTTLVVVKNDILGKTGRSLPKMLDYQVQIKGESMHNTPPVFAVYCSMLVLRWIEKIGGLEAIEARNNAKATLLYQEIDSNPLFKAAVADPIDRSTMNITFVMENPELEEKFMLMTKEANISGIKGHRSVGGFRASIYNAMEIESVQVLVDVMKQFTAKFG